MTKISGWYWLESGDDADLGWHDCIVGDWSLVVGGKDMAPVKRGYHGPWWCEFHPTIEREDSIRRGPFKYLREAKEVAIGMAQQRAAEVLNAIRSLKSGRTK